MTGNLLKNDKLAKDILEAIISTQSKQSKVINT